MSENISAGGLPFFNNKSTAYNIKSSKRGNFNNLLNGFSGQKNRPLALVKNGKEVSFQGMPFVDKSGSKIKLNINKKNGKLLVNIQRGPTLYRRKNDDSKIRFEQQLSSNAGVDQVLTEFQKLKMEHLQETRDIRHGIVNGKIETQGTKDAAFYRMHKELELKGKQVGNNSGLTTNGLSSLGQKISKTKAGKTSFPNRKISIGENNSIAGTKLTKLKGDEELDSDLKKHIDKLKGTLPHPLERQVKKFMPARISTKEPKISLKNNHAAQEPATKKSSPISGKQELITEDNNINKVSSNSIKTEKTENLLDDQHPIRNIIKETSKNITKETNPVIKEVDNEKPEKVLVAAEQKIAKMKSEGWEIRFPGTSKSKKNKTSNNTQPAVKSKKNNKSVKSANSTIEENVENDKIEMKDKTIDNQVISKPNNGSQLGTMQNNINNPVGKTIQPNSQSSQDNPAASSGNLIRNLDEILQKIAGKAKILNHDGKTSLHIRLQPKELGILLIKISKENDQYSVTMRAENPESAKAVEVNMAVIREHLAEAGIQIDKFEVETQNSKNQDFESIEKDKSNGRNGSGQRKGNDENAKQSTENEKTRIALKLGTNTVDFVG
ncbi:MAG: flagellar hook-length control protein FliK [Candidatus Electryonea clarkiae]|nr:flagellar hook-length control protein FliK [Candidatus Electryonea clarkiae]MDP8287303.1 flagellar hook-length control protein FliK [Candidatus Electryonea clarkiae]